MKRNRVLVAILIGILFWGNGVIFLSNTDRVPKLYSNSSGSKYKEPLEKVLFWDAEKKKENKKEKTTLSNENDSLNKAKKKKYAEDGNDSDKTKKTKDYDSRKSSNEGSDGSSKSGSNKSGDGKGGNVSDRKIVSLNYKWNGSDGLLYGKAIDYSKITVTAKYSNGEEENIPISKCKIDGFNSKKLGSGSCDIKYSGVSVKATYKINNWEKEIVIVSWNNSSHYKYGSAFKKSDMEVVVNMADGSKQSLDSGKYAVSGVNTGKLGTFTATVTYKSMSAKHKFTVINYAKRLSSTIKNFVVRGDVKWDKIVKDEKIEATMADGTKKTLLPSDYSVKGYTISSAGKKTATIEYDGANLNIPYQVYDDMLKVQAVNAPSITKTLYFTDTIKITSINIFDLPKQYKSEDGTKTYRLDGIYKEKSCNNKVVYPITFEAAAEFRINKDGLENHEYWLYADYKED